VSGLDELSKRLEALREASQRVCRRLLKTRSDIVAIMVVGSVARGNIHENSDVDLCVLVKYGEHPERERIRELDCDVEVVYTPLRLWRERLYRGIGSMWEIDVSNVVDSLVLYDPYGVVREIKRMFKVYPEEKRRMNILEIFHRMGWYEEAVRYHYLKKNYDVQSVFSKMYVMEALKILFPLNRVYLRGEKHMFEQLKELREMPPGLLEKCLSLLWFKSRGVKHEEATWILETVSDIWRLIKDKIRSSEPGLVR